MDFLKKNLLTVSAIAVIIIGGGTYLLTQNKTQTQKPSSNSRSSEEKKTVVTVTVKDASNEVSYPLTEGVGQTALAVTKKATFDQVETSGEGENAFVTSINSRKASAEKKEYWELVVNGVSAQVGAGSYIVNEGDKIEWRISNF